MKTHDSIQSVILLAVAFLAIPAARPAQAQRTAPANSPQAVTSPATPAITMPTVSARATDEATSRTTTTPSTRGQVFRPSNMTVPGLSAARTTATLTAQRPAGAKNLTFDWKGVPLDKVLDDLADKTNFIIHRDTPVTGTIDMVSLKPLNAEEAVDLLNDALTQKGFAAMVHDRDLHIMTMDAARVWRYTPVLTVPEASDITNENKVLTLIIPLKHAPAPRLLENLRYLVPAETVMTAVESSNAILVTDTLGNIRRVQDIVTKLDTELINVAQIRVYKLFYSDAVALAQTVTALFQVQGGGGGNNAGGRGGRGGGGGNPAMMFASMMAGGGAGGGAPGAPTETGQSAALQAASRVVAVADQRTNSMIVAAGADLLPLIDDLVSKVEVPMEDQTILNVFPLAHSDATAMATLITSMFVPAQTATTNQGGRGGGGRIGGFGGRGGAAAQPTGTSQRELAEARVVAVADLRTNSVVVSASPLTMDLVKQMIETLDKDSAQTQNVYVFSLNNAKSSDVYNVLGGMFPSNQSGGNRTTNRTNTTTNRNNTTTNRNNSTSGRTSGTSGLGSSSFSLGG